MLSDEEEIANNEQLPTEFKDMISIYNRRDKIENIVPCPLHLQIIAIRKLLTYSIALKDTLASQESYKKSQKVCI